MIKYIAEFYGLEQDIKDKMAKKLYSEGTVVFDGVDIIDNYIYRPRCIVIDEPTQRKSSDFDIMRNMMMYKSMIQQGIIAERKVEQYEQRAISYQYDALQIQKMLKHNNKDLVGLFVPLKLKYEIEYEMSKYCYYPSSMETPTYCGVPLYFYKDKYDIVKIINETPQEINSTFGVFLLD